MDLRSHSRWLVLLLLCASTLFAQAPPGGPRATAGTGAPVPELPAASSLTPDQRIAREQQWRAQIRHQLYVPDTLPELEARTWSSFTPTPGIIADRVTYQTSSGMLVPAIVYRPEHPGSPANSFAGVAHPPEQTQAKLPGIVVVNGHGSDKYGWYAFYSGMLLAKAGAVVVTYDPIGEGERNIDRKSRTGAHDKIVPPPPGVSSTDWGQRLAGLMQVDLMQAVSYLRSLPQVDPSRIAVVGYSMGSFISGIAGAIDLRVHAVLLSGGGDYDGPGGYFDSNPLPCQSPPYRSLSVLGDRGAVLYALNAARGPMLVMNGDADSVMDMAHHPPEWFATVRARATALRGTSQNMFTVILYPGISHRTSWVNRDGVAWLNQQIHFANWTADQIASAPTTHISTWAKANNVDITPSYIREDREGGLDALGTGLPGLTRKDLTVLSDADWQANKDRLTYEAWAQKTMAAQQAAAQH
jgi:dienelactone hydrolase